MNDNDSNTGFHASRRRFVGSSAALAVLGLAPGMALGRLHAPTGPESDLSPRTFLATIVDTPDGDARVRPFGLRRSVVDPDQPLLLRCYGPWPLQADVVLPPFRVSMRYRQCPDHPFSLWQASAGGEPGNQVLHATAGALAGVQVDCGDRTDLCALTGWIDPVLPPGRHVVLIDPTGRHARPNWAALRWDEDKHRVYSLVPEPVLAGLLLDVAVA